MAKNLYEQLIVDGIQGLPPDALKEIADFVYFVRTRVLQPEIFEEERLAALMKLELQELGRSEALHLEKEFENYDKLYPHE
jgi:uridine kinase